MRSDDPESSAHPGRADPNARDARGLTALHRAAGRGLLDAVNELIAIGSDVDAESTAGHTALEYSLHVAQNMQLRALAPVVAALIEAGAVVSETARNTMRSKAKNFEFHRSGFNPEFLDDTAEAVLTLCALIGIDPPAPRRVHDGTSPIVAHAARWQDQHNELWDLLVPSRGPSDTVQGELVRISGRLSDEITRNGGANWDADHRSMCDALCTWIASANALSPDIVDECCRLVDLLPSTDTTQRLCEIATLWVASNPEPIGLSSPDYRR